MLLTKFRVMTAEQALKLRESFLSVPFEDGLETAGAFVKDIKNNRQITERSKQGAPLLGQIASHLLNHKSIKVLAYPKALARIMTNIHGPGEFYGKHVDNTLIGQVPNSARADLSFTLFLTSPDEYEGGELKLWTSTGEITVKGDPGEVLLYDSGYLHEVQPVRSGLRVGTVGWIQSWVPNSKERETLSEFDICIAQIKQNGNVPREQQDALHKIYNSFLRLGMR